MEVVLVMTVVVLVEIEVVAMVAVIIDAHWKGKDSGRNTICTWERQRKDYLVDQPSMACDLYLGELMYSHHLQMSGEQLMPGNYSI